MAECALASAGGTGSGYEAQAPQAGIGHENKPLIMKIFPL
jgi:hypothetical protein